MLLILYDGADALQGSMVDKRCPATKFSAKPDKVVLAAVTRAERLAPREDDNPPEPPEVPGNPANCVSWGRDPDASTGRISIRIKKSGFYFR